MLWLAYISVYIVECADAGLASAVTLKGQSEPIPVDDLSIEGGVLVHMMIDASVD